MQQFVQESLPSMLRKAYKAKKMESVELMLQLRRIVCDWNGNNGEEPDNLYELKKKDRKIIYINLNGKIDLLYRH